MTPNQKLFIHWIKERWYILQHKKTGHPAPWSKDPIFQVTYFTNVNREDDKVTQWIRNNWLLDGRSAPVYELAMVTARLFNNPDTLAELEPPAAPAEDWLWLISDQLENRKERGEKLFNGAYIVSTNGKKIDKLTYVLSLLDQMLDLNERIAKTETLKEAHKVLMSYTGLASFMAAQVIADLKNTPKHHLSKAKDWWTFSAPGPGSLRGLSWFFEEKITAKNYDEKIKAAYEFVEYELPEVILDFLCNQNLQNCFCEYDKYMRILNGTGRSKRKYNGVK